ncbi:MAG: phytoene synthase [Candidatus Elarobacter sp.]
MRHLADVEQSYRACRDVTKRSSKTFYLASLFLPLEKRRAIWAIYAFCRTADDIADTSASPQERLAELDAWQEQLLAAFAGRPDHVLTVALADAVRRYDIPLQPALQLLHGARKDITVHRYETYEQLLEYCYLVASTVGLLVCPVLGFAPEATEYGIALGRAMQLTNILRDVGEDARLGRIYLPAEDVHRFGYSDAKLLAGVVDDAFIELMKFQVARVRAMYEAAAPGIEMLAPSSRYTVRLALTLYRRILDEIEGNGYDVFTQRAFVPVRTKFVVAMTTALARWRA